jgi:hypothetical protein
MKTQARLRLRKRERFPSRRFSAMRIRVLSVADDSRLVSLLLLLASASLLTHSIPFSLGLTVKNARPAIVYVPRDVSPGELGRFFRETVQKLGGPPPELLLCFLPSKPNPFYGPIKMFGDIVVGCATQCVFIPKAAKGNAQCESFSLLSLF